MYKVNVEGCFVTYKKNYWSIVYGEYRVVWWGRWENGENVVRVDSNSLSQKSQSLSQTYTNHITANRSTKVYRLSELNPTLKRLANIALEVYRVNSMYL